jgi:hypothetical protein
MHSCCKQVSEFSYLIRTIFISHVYRGNNEKFAACRWSWVGGHEAFSVVFSSAMFIRRRRVRHLSYHFRWYGRLRRRIDDAVFPLVLTEGEKHAKQLLIMDVFVFVFIYRTFRYAKYIQTKNESCLLDPSRFTKRWWGVSREMTVTASSSLVTIKGANILHVTSHFFSSCPYYLRSCH